MRFLSRKVALRGGASLVALLAANSAWAQIKTFDVPSEDAIKAIPEFARQAGIQILAPADQLKGVRTAAVQGDFDLHAALRKLLDRTGVTIASDDGQTIALSAPEKPAPVKVAQAARRAPAAPIPAAPAAAIETVVVTAQHKSEDIQQVPIAITALSQQQLTERQIAGGPDLVKEVPNLTFSKTNFSGYNLEIRGIGTQAISVTTDPAVAVAFNDISFIRNHFFEQEFYDLADVEVLRGPQGTLYGRNATAGVVNIQSALPTDTYQAMLSADIGNYDSRRYEAMLNLPIVGDQLDIRIAGEWTKRDGYSFNDITDQPIDGRDLWSGRMTIGWKPASNVQTWLVWEHFSEDDDRLRSGKQLCTPVPVPTEVGGVLIGTDDYAVNNVDLLSQGCGDGSLYSPAAFGVPNGNTLPFWEGLYDVSGHLTNGNDPYEGTTQSTNLRVISSELNPTYKAKNDTLEFNADWAISPALTFTSQTGYNHDFLWSTEDYDRFASTPGVFDLSNRGPGLDAGNNYFCDPQLGCSNRLEAEDLSDEHAWQLSQEFRLASKYDGPINFSFGGNYLHYETEENYYVFSNALTLLALNNFEQSNPGSPGVPPYQAGVFTNSWCLRQPYQIAAGGSMALVCNYIDPNPIGSLNNQGHNYFLSQNPYILNSYATFGEIYYNVTNDFKLTAGGRWTEDQKHFIDIPSEVLTYGYGYPVFGVTDQQWDALTGRLVADWTPQLDFTDQTLIYASASHGYKAGGANPPGAELLGALNNSGGQVLNPIHPATFKPEYIQAFELGTKNALLDNSLTLNGDIFYYNYTGYQISEIVDRSAINLNFNAHIDGAELEANWEPLPGLKFGLAQGFENTVLAGGSEAVDLMDRTADQPDWIVVRPFITQASNCILPIYVVAALNSLGETNSAQEVACGNAYNAHLDPVTGLPYQQNPSVAAGGFGIPAGYPGFNPLTAPNNGEGFDKDLSGYNLPNAPHFTTSLTAEYTIPVSDDWAATLHTDFYWQSQQWARVFEDPIDKIHGYSTTNVSLILTSANGWQVMAYVKNVFDVTAITGTFLNSDDTDLTTNVFLTDPRLFGVRVTKQLDQNDGFWGGDLSGYEFFTNLFSDSDNGKPPLWIELGGQLDRLDDGQTTFAPPFVLANPDAVVFKGASPLAIQKMPLFSLDEDAKISFEPDGSDWVFSASIRYGRSQTRKSIYRQNEPTPLKVHVFGSHYVTLESHESSGYPSQPEQYDNASAASGEKHEIIDFDVGKDVGLGMLGASGSSVLNAGVRFAQFNESARAQINSDPDFHFGSVYLPTFRGIPSFHVPGYFRHNYHGASQSKRSFHGVGPSISWNASAPLAGETRDGEVTLDWGANAAVLFGRQRARVQHQTSGSYHKRYAGNFLPLSTSSYHKSADLARSRMVAVPNLGGFVGLSMRYNNAKVSFGYRADEFFGAMDGGIDTYKSENRGFFGPFANISIGLGG
jgi:iron complex outermembrane receptor protein